MKTLEQSKPADEARDSVLRSGSVSSCNDLLARPVCGSSWAGFWKRPDRYEAWMAVSTSASTTADGYALANKRNGLPMECESVRKLNNLFSWAYRRAKKYRPDLVKIYRQ